MTKINNIPILKETERFKYGVTQNGLGHYWPVCLCYIARQEKYTSIYLSDEACRSLRSAMRVIDKHVKDNQQSEQVLW